MQQGLNRQSVSVRARVLVAAALVAVPLVVQVATAPARNLSQRATVITVTAGKPTELAFTLSRRVGLPLGAVTFHVTNRGKVAHQFTVCAYPSSGAFGTACTGSATKELAPGSDRKSTRLNSSHIPLSRMPSSA